MYMYGAFEPKKRLSDRMMRRIERIAAAHDSAVNGGEVPGVPGRYLYWFYTLVSGEPGEERKQQCLHAIAAAGITLPYRD